MQNSYDVLIVGGAPFQAYEWLSKKAKTAKCIVAVDRGGSYCLRAGVSPNVLMGDFDSINSADFSKLKRAKTKLLQYECEKDETDLHLALAYAKKELKAKRMLMVACTKGRLDHELAVLGACLATKGVAIDIASSSMRAYLLRPKARGALSIPASNKRVSILALSEPCRLQTLGLKWNLNNEELTFLSDRGVSNKVLDERASIFCKKGAALVICC